jgi:hypothetical protein
MVQMQFPAIDAKECVGNNLLEFSRPGLKGRETFGQADGGVWRPAPNCRGIAGSKFLNRFQYGNFGNADAFGLEPFAAP